MLSETEKLDALARLGVDLNQVQDLDILMERILTEARRFVSADAGSIYIRDQQRLRFTYTQNDTLQSRLEPGEKLIFSTFTIPINDNSIAGYVAESGKPLNLTDVYRMDSNRPYHFDKTFDNKTQYATQSVLTISLETPNEDLLGILQIINAQNETSRVIPFSASDESIMMHFASIAAVALARAQMIRAMLLRMMKMAEMRDPKETGAHVNRVAGYAVEIYEKWAHRSNLSQKEIDKNRDILRMAAMLHDVGKVAISDLILKKPGRFNEKGKKGEEIPLFGRIVAIADVYDALSNERVYKEAWDESDVLAKIQSDAGRQFDPELVEIFFSCLHILRFIQKRYRDHET